MAGMSLLKAIPASYISEIVNLEMTVKRARSLLFQPAELAAMMPYRLSLYLDRILAAIVACAHLLDKLMRLFRGHAPGLDPPHLAAMNSMMALRFVDCHDGVFGIVLALAIAQVEQISIIEAVAEGPLMVDQGLYEIVFSFELLEGEYAVGMNHHFHLSQGYNCYPSGVKIVSS